MGIEPLTQFKQLDTSQTHYSFFTAVPDVGLCEFYIQIKIFHHFMHRTEPKTNEVWIFVALASIFCNKSFYVLFFSIDARALEKDEKSVVCSSPLVALIENYSSLENKITN